MAFADLIGIGAVDLLATTGHPRHGANYIYANPPILWRNRGGGKFDNVSRAAGPYFQQVHNGRGLATGDLDNDGDLDVVIVHHHKLSVVLWNESPNEGHWLSVKLNGRPPTPTRLAPD